jgi:prevent-host-death family protein
MTNPAAAVLDGRAPIQPWPALAKLASLAIMRVNVGKAKTDLSKLLARVEAGEEVEIARNGVPVARLVRIEPSTPGERFLAAAGSMAGSIRIGDDFEFTEEELDEMLDNPHDPLG